MTRAFRWTLLAAALLAVLLVAGWHGTWPGPAGLPPDSPLERLAEAVPHAGELAGPGAPARGWSLAALMASIALATLINEDLACISAGLLVAQGRMSFFAGTLASLGGIFVGDLALFGLGSAARRWLPASRLAARFLPGGALERASDWLSRRGLAVVFVSRFTPGLRLPTYVAAGALEVPFWRFAALLGLAAAVWTPVVVGLASAAGGPVLASATPGARTLAALAASAAAVQGLSVLLRRGGARAAPLRAWFSSGRRRAGTAIERMRWEFWPAWLAYVPVAAWVALLALRHRSLTVFTAANPGMGGAGGFAGESKAAILEGLRHAGWQLPAFTLLPAGLDAESRLVEARRFLERNGVRFPIVVKPDQGERGAGVRIVRTSGELAEALAAAPWPAILQEYVPGPEFGVFYYRMPGQPRGRILAITEKRFPELTGDGERSVAELVRADRRAACLAGVYLAELGPRRDTVPAAGERVPLTEIGNHCRGAVFLDGTRYRTAALEERIDGISRGFAGFWFGRYDVRAASLAAFQAGRFRIIELNGVASEATNIYDPALSLWDAYGILFLQWRLAFAIGAANRDRGARPWRLSQLMRLILDRGRSHTSGAVSSGTHLRTISSRSAPAIGFEM